ALFREPDPGSEAIRQYWQRGAGTQREVAVRMGRPIITDNRVAVEWWTTMIDPDEGEITLPGCLLLRFASDGRCQDLWEYWQVQPGRQDPPTGWGTEPRACRLLPHAQAGRVATGPGHDQPGENILFSRCGGAAP